MAPEPSHGVPARWLMVATVVLLATSSLVVSEQQLPETPLGERAWGVHFTAEGDPRTEVTVSWFTEDIVRYPKVRWAQVGQAPRVAWAANESYYYAADILHKVRFAGLQPGASYQFWAGDEDWGYRGPFNYTTSPNVGPLRLAVWGNIGNSSEARALRDQLIAADPDVVVLLGDLAYANNDPAVWRSWFKTMEPLLGSRLLVSAVGHAEDESSRGKEPWLTAFSFPSPERYYALRHSGVELVVLDSGQVLAGGSGAADQLGWLGTHLRLADASSAVRWKMAFYHHPAFATGISDQGRPLRDKLSPYFHQNHVELAFQAHEGYYERTHQMTTGNNLVTNQTTVVTRPQDGTLYWLAGGGGAALGTRGLGEQWTAFGDVVHHVVLVDVNANDTVHVRGIKTDGTAFDHVWLSRGPLPAADDVPLDEEEPQDDEEVEEAPPEDDDASEPPPEEEQPPVEEEDDPFDEEDSETPGPGVVAVLAAATGAAALLRRRRGAGGLR